MNKDSAQRVLADFSVKSFQVKVLTICWPLGKCGRYSQTMESNPYCLVKKPFMLITVKFVQFAKL